LAEQAFDPQANLLALSAEGIDLVLKTLDGWNLGLDFNLQRFRSLLGGDAGLTLATDQADGAQDAFFKSCEIVDGKHGHGFWLDCNGWVGFGIRRAGGQNGFSFCVWMGFVAIDSCRTAGRYGLMARFIASILPELGGFRFHSIFGEIAGGPKGRIV
jgi:hypothetical protein